MSSTTNIVVNMELINELNQDQHGSRQGTNKLFQPRPTW